VLFPVPAFGGIFGLGYVASLPNSPENITMRVKIDPKAKAAGPIAIKGLTSTNEVFGYGENNVINIFRDSLAALFDSNPGLDRTKISHLMIGHIIAHELMHALGYDKHASENGFVDSENISVSNLGKDGYSKTTAIEILKRLGCDTK